MLAIMNLVLQGKYQWSPVRRIKMPKIGGGPRNLEIPTVQDQLVQEVLCMLLEAIYEPVFLESSYGFRPGLDTHTALQEVQKTFARSTWIIEGDISMYFNTVNHETLILILKERIDDHKLIELISAGLRSRVLLPDGVFTKTNETRVLQENGTASLVLANIYLHKLDVWMAAKEGSYDRKFKKRGNKLHNQF